MTNLEKCQEEIQLLLGGAFLEVNSANFDYATHQTDTKKIVWQIQGTEIARSGPAT